MPLSAVELEDLQLAAEAGGAAAGDWQGSWQIEMADRSTHLVYSRLGQVLELGGPGLAEELSDATSHLSGGWSEKISALGDGGSLKVRLRWDGSDPLLLDLSQAALEQSLESFRLELPGLTLQFEAFVGLSFAAARGRLQLRLVLALSGKPLVV